MRSVGIDIGSFSIKVAELVSAQNSYSVRDFFEVPIRLEQDRRVQINEALRRIATHFDPSRTKLVVAVGQQDVSTRTKFMPFKEKHKILKALAFELEDEIPFEEDNAIFDAKINSFRGQGAELLTVTCPHQRVKDILDLCHEAGFDPDIVSVDAFGLANNFELWQNAPETLAGERAQEPSPSENPSMDETVVHSKHRPAHIVLDLGHARTLVLVFCEGRLQTARTCSYGGRHLIEALRRRYNISVGEATKIFQERGFILTTREGANEDQVFFSETIVGALKPLIDELKISFLELKSELQVSFEKIGILGGVAGLQNIAAYLTSQLELPVNQIRHFEKHPKIEIPYQEPTERIAATAIGLALEGFKRPRNPPIQLRRGEFAKQSQRAKFFFEKWSHTLTLCGFALLGLFVYSYLRVVFTEDMVLASEDRIRALAKGPPAALKGSQLSVSGLEKFVREKTKEINTQKTLAQTRFINSPLDVIEELSSKAPQNKDEFPLEITHLKIVDDIMEIEGDLALPQQITQLRGLLKNLSQDQKVTDLKPKHVAGPNRMAFAFALKARRKPKGVDSGI